MRIYLFLLAVCPCIIAQDMSALIDRLANLQAQFVGLQNIAQQWGIITAPTVPVTEIVLPSAVVVPTPKEEIVPEMPPVVPQPAIVGPHAPLPPKEPLPEILKAHGGVPEPTRGKRPVEEGAPGLQPVSAINYEVNKVSGPRPTLLADLEKKRVLFDPFEYVMGMKEKDFQKKSLAEKLGYDRIALGQHQVGLPKGTGFFAGNFKEYSVGELRTLYAQTKRGTGCRFYVLEAVDRPYDDGTGRPNWFLPLFDVGAIQADSRSRNAVIQVASNFNGLEGGGSPAQGIMPYITEGLYVQGEAAAVSAMPGLIYRMYFVPHMVNGEQYIGQLREQLNFLREIPAITIVNGYPTKVDLTAFNNLSPQAYDAMVQKVHIGFHEGIQVTSGLGALRGKGELLGERGFKAVKIDDDNQRICQVLTAAFNLSGTSGTTYETVARLLLDAAYEGTLKSSYVNGKKSVYLTLVGGGVFKNDPAWIVDAIIKALDDFMTKGDMEITLLIYAFPGDKTKADSLRKKLLAYATGMNGSYLQFKTDGTYKLEPAAK